MEEPESLETDYIPTPEFILSRKIPENDVLQAEVYSPTLTPSHKVRLPTRNIGATLSNDLHWITMMIEFLIHLTLVITGAMHSEHFRYPHLRSVQEAIEVGFTDRNFVTTNDQKIKFDEIKSCNDVWNYLNNLVLGNLYASYVYHDEIFKLDKMQTHKTILDHNILIGVPRIGQSRVTNDSCKIHPLFTKMYDKCYGPYSEDTKDTEEFLQSAQYDAFRYKDNSQAKSVNFDGDITSYPGSGYYMDLYDNKLKTAEALDYLAKNLWITRATRFIFFSFTLYNPSYHVFGNVRLGFEFPTVGGVIPVDGTTVFVHKMNYIRFISCIIYYVITLVLMGIIIRDFMYFKFKIFTMFWTYMDISFIGLSLTLLYYFVRQEKITEDITFIKNNDDVYGNVENACYYFKKERDITVVALYMNCMSLFRYSSICRNLQQLNLTIRKCFISVLSFSIMFIIVFCAFSAFAFLVFGTKVDGYHTFGDCMIKLFCSVLGELNYNELYEVNYIFAPIFFMSFTFLVFFVLLNMFLAIINDSYTDVATELSKGRHSQLIDYLKSNWFPKHMEFGQPKFVTSVEIQSVLSSCGYDDMEINEFIAHSLKSVSNLSLLEEIEHKEKPNHVKPEDIDLYEKRLDHIAETIGRCNKAIMNVHAVLENIKNVNIKNTKKKN